MISPLLPQLLVSVGSIVALSGTLYRIRHECNGLRISWVGFGIMLTGLGAVVVTMW